MIAPDSRARPGGGPGCASDGAALAAREAELRYALRQIRILAWVRQHAVFVLAVGQGAAAVARDDDASLAGSILIGLPSEPHRAAPSLGLIGGGPSGAPAVDDQQAVVDFLRRLTLR
jgi:hypothetical protein